MNPEHRLCADTDKSLRHQNIFLAVSVGIIALAVLLALLGGIVGQIVSMKPFRHRLDLYLRRSLLCINPDHFKNISTLKQLIQKKKYTIIRNLSHIMVTKYHELTLFTQGLIFTHNLKDCIAFYMKKRKKPIYFSLIAILDLELTITSDTKIQTQSVQSGDLFLGPLHPQLMYNTEKTPMIVTFWYEKPFPNENSYDIRKIPIQWLHPKKQLKQLKIQITK